MEKINELNKSIKLAFISRSLNYNTISVIFENVQLIVKRDISIHFKLCRRFNMQIGFCTTRYCHSDQYNTSV